MENVQTIRFLTANYATLQGLRAVPLSLLALLVAWWSNVYAGKTRNVTLPIILLILSFAIYFAIDRYYNHKFGRVQQSKEYRWFDIVTSIGGAAVALAAFFWDISGNHKLSAVGLVFALTILASWLRLIWKFKRPLMLFYPFFAGIIALVSILPLLGLESWYTAIGFRSPLVAVLGIFGLAGVIIGILSHFQLLRMLHNVQEAQ